MVVSDGLGSFDEMQGIYMAAMNFVRPENAAEADLIELPPGSKLVDLAGRVPIGYDPDLEKFIQLREYNGNRVYPVAAILPGSYLQICRPAYTTVLDAPRLGEHSLAPVGKIGKKYYTTAHALRQIHHPEKADFAELDQLAEDLIGHFPDNPIANHWAHHWQLRTFSNSAINFLRKDGAITVPLQIPQTNLDAEDARGPLRPEISAITDIAGAHLEQAKSAVVNFDLPPGRETALREVIRIIRSSHPEGRIEVRCSGTDPEAVEHLCQEGVNAVYVKLNSFQKDYYETFNPTALFANVIDSMKTIAAETAELKLEYQVFPGLTDHPTEIEALRHHLSKIKVDALSPRNLHIDPDWYIDELRLFLLSRDHVGMRQWLEQFTKHIG